MRNDEVGWWARFKPRSSYQAVKYFVQSPTPSIFPWNIYWRV
ncbi:hypothetical protein FOXG_19795 [Fusarium oxysporum f. sp. lycopersici 4287]|uniref:Uncharacterized protein n=2 Tax=Fusarium oxysporum TaxID=5507 RepID=A0A0J9V751_FUSO4|nr:hypothetical protein FOXG_19795 [Fusarium oxysporum f. sp. lycopersici 4287]EXK31863.1 hypothetical protein FOMG_12267 [Fusarium oxysporum f. sp. melonis 26406]KNB07008.1 hypothetical protein FOXG_19795 [Fusarium oxysporum f. sp. lycopersici 4287]